MGLAVVTGLLGATGTVVFRRPSQARLGSSAEAQEAAASPAGEGLPHDPFHKDNGDSLERIEALNKSRLVEVARLSALATR